MHINLDVANPNTMFHESAHPFVTSLHKLAETNPEVETLLDNIKKDLNTIGGGKYIKWAMRGYGVDKKGFPTDNEADIVNMDRVMQEALVEFLADVGLQKYEDNQSIINKAKVDFNAPINLTLEDLSKLTDIEGVKKVFTQSTTRGLNFNEKYEKNESPDAKNQYSLDEQFESHKENGGSSFNSFFGNISGPFAMVSIFPELSKTVKGRDITRKDLEDYRKANQGVLNSDKHLAVGTWYDSESNSTYLDVSVAIPLSKLDEAKRLGVEYNQKAIFNLETFEDVPTGGTGEATAQGDATIDERIQTIKNIVGKVDPKEQRNVEVNARPGFTTLNNALNFSDIYNGSPKQWINEIKKYGGKNIDNEMSFMGVKDFLESVDTSYPGGIPKVAIQDYIEMHQTSIQFTGNTMRIIRGNETLADLDYESKLNEDGERVLFIKNIKACY